MSSEGKGKITLDGLDAAHPLGLLFDRVMVDPKEIKLVAHHARVQVGKGGLNLLIAGEDVVVSGGGAGKSDFQCEAKFVLMPME